MLSNCGGKSGNTVKITTRAITENEEGKEDFVNTVIYDSIPCTIIEYPKSYFIPWIAKEVKKPDLIISVFPKDDIQSSQIAEVFDEVYWSLGKYRIESIEPIRSLGRLKSLYLNLRKYNENW